MRKNNISVFDLLICVVPLIAALLLVWNPFPVAAGVAPPQESRPAYLAFSPARAALSPARPIFSPARAAIHFYQRYISDLRFGRCQFNPSCSRYAEKAIKRFGFLKGTVLAADRLIRCNGSAHRYHERGADGRLLDPVGGEPAPRTHPTVPAWLIPVIEEFPVQAAELDARLIENISFANALAERGDCWRAETEYLRVAFLADRPSVSTWAHMMIGRCCFRVEEWDEAAGSFLEAARSAERDSNKMDAAFMAAAAFFNKGSYSTCGKIVGRYAPHAVQSPAVIERLAFLDGLCLLARGCWDEGKTKFAAMASAYPASRYRRQAAFLAEKAAGGPDLPRKNPALAAVLSTLLPGSGQLYAGRRFDAFRHFIFNGLLIYTVYQLFSEEHYTGGYLVAGIALPFYLGNIFGAGRSSEYFNASTRAAYLSRWIEEAGAR